MKIFKTSLICLLLALLFPPAICRAQVSVSTDVPNNQTIYSGQRISGNVSATSRCNLNHNRIAIEVYNAWNFLVDTIYVDCYIPPGTGFSHTCSGSFSTNPINAVNDNEEWYLRICAQTNPHDTSCPAPGFRDCIYRYFNVRLCSPTGCDGYCPDFCTPTDDPDCGCVHNDGCCAPGCDPSTDNDCALPPPTQPTQPTGYDNPLLWANIPQFLLYALRFIFNLLLGISILMIVIAGIFLAASRGDPIRQAKGKRTLLFAVLGFAIAFLAQGLFMLFRIIFGVRF